MDGRCSLNHVLMFYDKLYFFKLETSFYVLEVIYSPDLSNTVTSLSIAVCLSSNHPSQCKSPLTLLVTTVDGYKLDHVAVNSTMAVAAEVRVNPALPATAVVEFMAKWLNLVPRTVIL